jgi:SpoVK/Ycf46/Vps4 family AAA+-type ATPase
MALVKSTSNTSFIPESGRLINAGLARTIILGGDIQDLFPLNGSYVSLIEMLGQRFNVGRNILVVYELNGPIRFINPGDQEKVRKAWILSRNGKSANDLMIEKTAANSASDKQAIAEQLKQFDLDLAAAQENPALGLEFLRQLCICSRSSIDGQSVLEENLIIIVERADLLIPTGETSRLSDSDRRRVSICHDWFSDTAFLHGKDSVILIAESRSLINSEIAKLPQLMEVEVKSPSYNDRLDFIKWFEISESKQLKLWGTKEDLAAFTAGLSLHALRQLLANSGYDNHEIEPEDVIGKVEEYIKSQVGDDVIEFARPTHKLDDLMGFRKLKVFLKEELIPRFRAADDSALSGAAVCGPIGGGKTFIFEAVAAELGIPILVLKNLRSKWFGETDVIIERLRRAIEALMKVIIFVDEADTQFGSIKSDTHETERRLTGKIQAMMSDSKLRGKVSWLLMTARINMLSPDIRRPGRVGELIIPVFDPEDLEDIDEFIHWVAKPICSEGNLEAVIDLLIKGTTGYSAASYASLRSELIAKQKRVGAPLQLEEIEAVINDLLPAQIGLARQYQKLQALLNCTRRSLLPCPERAVIDRQKWEAELALLEARGIGAT